MINIDILQRLEDIFNTTNNFILYFFRYIFWYILKGLHWLISNIELALQDIFKNINLFNSPKIIEFVNDIKPITNTLLVIGIIIIGYKLMTNTLNNRKMLIFNLVTVIMLFTGFQGFLLQMSSITTATTNAFMDINGSNISTSILKNSITDLKYLDNNNFSNTSLENKNNLSEQAINRLDPTELMNPKDTKNKEVFSNKLYYDENNQPQLKKLDDGHFLGVGSDLFSEYYYRYKIDWFTLSIIFPCIALALIWSCIKVGEQIFQLAYTFVFTLFVAPLDVSTGQRTKKCVQKILHIFFVLMSIALMYRIYFYSIEFAQSIAQNVLLQLFLIVSFSIGLINGPNITQELFGIDAGTSVSSMYYTTQMIGNAVRSGLNAPKKAINSISNGSKHIGSAINKSSNAIAGISGYSSGRIQGLNELKDKQDNNKPNNDNLSNLDNLKNKETKSSNDLNALNDMNNADNDKATPSNDKLNDGSIENNLNDNNKANLSDNSLNEEAQQQNTVDDFNNNLKDSDKSDLKGNSLNEQAQQQNAVPDFKNNLKDSDKSDLKGNSLNEQAQQQNAVPNFKNNLKDSDKSDLKGNSLNEQIRQQDTSSNSKNNLDSNNVSHSTSNNNPYKQNEININGSVNQSINDNQNNNISNKQYNSDKTTTLNDVLKQKFDNSTFGKSISNIQGTYTRAKTIGYNTSLSKENSKKTKKSKRSKQ